MYLSLFADLGTRTLIDNLDNGVSAVSITAKYNGIYHCFRSITKHEGWWALYGVRFRIPLSICSPICACESASVFSDRRLRDDGRP